MHLPELTLDASKRIGTIRAINGVNLAPALGDSFLPAYNELHAACARMHDAPYNSNARDLVDISRIFPLFHLDHNDPRNYRFKETDDYLKQCIDGGTPVYYRLGESIEHQPVKYRIHPPADFQKWAEICTRVEYGADQGDGDGDQRRKDEKQDQSVDEKPLEIHPSLPLQRRLERLDIAS